MLNRISSWILKVLGWRVTGKPPRDLKKYIIIVIPHTSNWDFPLGLLVRSKTGIQVNFIGKKSLFKPPWGFLFRRLGGYPVDRTKRASFVDNAVELFKENERFALTIAPEGTRSRTDHLKSGFYYIALGAKVPIIMVKFDYEHKVVDFADPFEPTGEKEDDFEFIEAHFKGVRGKHPEYSYGID
ncbi:MAG TPA: lysophospholipid acyltransferase family protein [Saprospiraceae bacterium]|nr:lysophospholipid acyltransferase family protein [Saprospiraceae bacterium]